MRKRERAGCIRRRIQARVVAPVLKGLEAVVLKPDIAGGECVRLRVVRSRHAGPVSCSALWCPEFVGLRQARCRTSYGTPERRTRRMCSDSIPAHRDRTTCRDRAETR